MLSPAEEKHGGGNLISLIVGCPDQEKGGKKRIRGSNGAI